MIVVDTNIIVYLHIEGDKTQDVEKLFLQDPVWIAPSLWRDEFINVLCTYNKTDNLDMSTCFEIFNNAEKLMGDNIFTVPATKIIDTTKRTGCSGYDSQFIALAEDLDLTLYTYDQKILKNCNKVAKTP